MFETGQEVSQARRVVGLPIFVAVVSGLIAVGALAVLAVVLERSPNNRHTSAPTTSIATRTSTTSSSNQGAAPSSTDSTAATITADARQNIATMETSEGTIVITLDFATAPKAARNFATLVKRGFYNGLTFHRAAKDFVIQGGDPNGDGSGGPGYTIQGETPENGYQLGSVAMSKTGADPPGTSGSQFFIVTGINGTRLPPDYASIGNVSRGLDVAQKIESYAPTDPPYDGTPTKKVTIRSINLSANG